MSGMCSIEDCQQSSYARGWCDNHYRRYLHHGTPEGGQPSSTVRFATSDDLRARLARGLDQIDNPVALATRYLAQRRLLGGRDETDLLDAAIDAIVDAALAWDPHGGRSILSWAWLYMDRNVTRELGRRAGPRREQLGRQACVSSEEWMHYDAGGEGYIQAELRIDLQHWADLAELTPLMRFLVSYAALHGGTYVRDTALAAAGPTPLQGSGSVTLKLALGHMRRAAVTGQRRDDAWTRAHPEGRAARLAKSNRLLDRLRSVEAERDRLAAKQRAS